jgi:malate dehydrogenase (oxaloacetate-decarboxylating)(NADP+)
VTAKDGAVPYSMCAPFLFKGGWQVSTGVKIVKGNGDRPAGNGSIYTEALTYHAGGRPGKLEIRVTKACASQHDLSLAYSPGVAAPVRAIAADPAAAARYTARGNLVAVVSNGTAVLGLGNVGPAAAKPVMEGKAILFKRFADIDAFDLEVAASEPEDLVRVVRALEPGFGGINLEDIKAPECFAVEEALRAAMSIPVFHDDQHGTAVIIAAALLNALEVAGKKAPNVHIVINGAGASAIATAHFLAHFGVGKAQITMVDTKGVLYEGRPGGFTRHKAAFATSTRARSLGDALRGADVLIALSVAGAVTGEMLRSMRPSPIVFALANPDPEISYEEATALRPDAIVATGRSDYPNQVNNVLGFPYIFRGALDVQARAITDGMKIAAAQALAALAKEPVPQEVLEAYNVTSMPFGADYLLPKPVDHRVALWVAPAVAAAAIQDRVARRMLDTAAYRKALRRRLAPGTLPDRAPGRAGIG